MSRRARISARGLILFVRLENKSEGHNKFYELQACAFEDTATGKDNAVFVSLHFGKIGGEGRVIHKPFNSRGEALSFAHEKAREKLARGYAVVVEREA